VYKNLSLSIDSEEIAAKISTFNAIKLKMPDVVFENNYALIENFLIIRYNSINTQRTTENNNDEL